METPNTEMPNIGDRVWWVPPSGRFTPAIVIFAHSENVVDLVVFADSTEGTEFATGTALRHRATRYIKKAGDEYPPQGTWFVPQGMWVPHQ